MGCRTHQGFAEEASVFLARERDILGVGVETVGTDAGIAPTFDTPFPTHYYMHEANRYGLTQLANVHQLPARGSIIIAAPLKITEGSGSPIRPLALVPKSLASVSLRSVWFRPPSYRNSKRA